MSPDQEAGSTAPPETNDSLALIQRPRMDLMSNTDTTKTEVAEPTLSPAFNKRSPVWDVTDTRASSHNDTTTIRPPLRIPFNPMPGSFPSGERDTFHSLPEETREEGDQEGAPRYFSRHTAGGVRQFTDFWDEKSEKLRQPWHLAFTRPDDNGSYLITVNGGGPDPAATFEELANSTVSRVYTEDDFNQLKSETQMSNALAEELRPLFSTFIGKPIKAVLKRGNLEDARAVSPAADQFSAFEAYMGPQSATDFISPYHFNEWYGTINAMDNMFSNMMSLFHKPVFSMAPFHSRFESMWTGCPICSVFSIGPRPRWGRPLFQLGDCDTTLGYRVPPAQAQSALSTPPSSSEVDLFRGSPIYQATVPLTDALVQSLITEFTQHLYAAQRRQNAVLAASQNHREEAPDRHAREMPKTLLTSH